jgi:hypothetical protein
MNIRKHLITSLAVAGLTLGLSTARVSAEPLLKGTFELPTAAYWGNTLLQPGQYTIWMSTEARNIGYVPVIHISGEGVNATFLSVARPEKESNNNHLDIANIDGTYVIRAFDAGLIGESFAFEVTKGVKSKALRASVNPEMIITVSSE